MVVNLTFIQQDLRALPLPQNFTTNFPLSLPQSSLEDTAGDDEPHDLVGALQNAVHAQVAEDALHWVVLQVAVGGGGGGCGKGWRGLWGGVLARSLRSKHTKPTKHEARTAN